MPKKRAPRPKPGVTIPSSLSGYGGDGVEGPTTRGRFSPEVGAMGYCAGPVIASGMPEGTSSFFADLESNRISSHLPPNHLSNLRIRGLEPHEACFSSSLSYLHTAALLSMLHIHLIPHPSTLPLILLHKQSKSDQQPKLHPSPQLLHPLRMSTTPLRSSVETRPRRQLTTSFSLSPVQSSCFRIR